MAKGALALSGLGGCFLFGSEFGAGFDLRLAGQFDVADAERFEFFGG